MIVTISGAQPHITIAGTVSIEERIHERSQASFECLTSQSVHYQKGEPVYIYDEDGNLQFGGVIDEAEEEVDDHSEYMLHRIRVVDWHYLADKRYVARAYVNETAGDIVRDLINGLISGTPILEDEGVTIGAIDDGPVITQTVFNYITVARAIESLCEKTGYWWVIRPNKALYFQPRSAITAPWTLTNDDPLLGTVSMTRGNPYYRNQQYLKGGRAITDLQTEIQTGDGDKRAYIMSFPLNNEPTISVSIGGGAYSAKTVGIGGVETGHDWYWNKGEAIVYQDNGATPLDSADKVKVEYYGQFDMVVLVYDPSQIAARQNIEGGGTGIVEHVEERFDITGRDAGFEAATGLLTTYAKDGATLEFELFKEGIQAGQLLTVNLPEHDIDNEEFLIESVSIIDY